MWVFVEESGLQWFIKVQQKTVNIMQNHHLCNTNCPSHSLALFYTGCPFLGSSFTYAAFVSLKVVL